MIAAPAKHRGSWTMIVNEKVWNLKADKILDPILSKSGKIVATVIEKQGQWFLAINNKIVSNGYDYMASPVISPDETKVMIKAVKDKLYTRQLISLDTALN